jgi:hypothetical protein
MTQTPLITDAELREICAELDEDTDSTIFINNAHTMMLDLYSGSTLFLPDRLKLIELYLAAHFVAITYTPTASEAIVGKVQQSFQYKVGLGFEQTKYGQQALALSNGTVASRRVSINYLGKRYADN